MMKTFAYLILQYILISVVSSDEPTLKIFSPQISTPAPKLYPSFNRSCDNSNDCQYQNGVVKNTVYLSCEDDVCVCERFRYIADVPSWNLMWDGNECRIAETGPCGESKGLKISCQQGLECLEGRCRDPNKIHKAPLNNYCNENIDCEEKLVCKATSFYFFVNRTCVKPETPALPGFED